MEAEEILVLVASDGAGSASHSEIGAKLACDSFVELVTPYLAEAGHVARVGRALSEDWAWTVAERVRLEAEVLRVKSRELACTLLAAVVAPRAAAFFQIGDGAIVIDDGLDYRTVFWPQSGEYVNTTFFLTDDSAVERLQFSLLQLEVSEVAILTDGLQMLALNYASRTAYTPFFRPMFASLRGEARGESARLGFELRAFLDSAAINSRTDDDKTLLLASRRPTGD